MLYEIINPSDPYTMETDDREAASLACLLLGSGRYALRSIGGDGWSTPLFIFGGSEEWWAKEFGYPLTEAVERVGRERIATALETVLIGDADDRTRMTDAMSFIDDPAKRQAFRDQQHDRARTSINNIGGRAYRMADSLRAAATPAGAAS